MIYKWAHHMGISIALVLFSTLPLQAKDIVIATSSMTLTSIPYLVAIERKFFDREGLTAHYVVMRSDLAVNGLITGDVDYNQSVSSVLRAGAAGAPVITVAGIYNRTFFDLVAGRDIKSLAELKGKTVGTSHYGASAEYALRFGLKANGIEPDKQIKSMARYLRTSDITSLEESYDIYAKRIMSDTPVPSQSAFRAAIEYVARDFPSAAKLRPEDVYDTSLVQSAVARLGR
jgi:ABC-type nitrate/sulfonate/bicarbonate transport system substrate-binding protein